MHKQTFSLLLIAALTTSCAATGRSDKAASVLADLNIAVQKEDCDQASAALARLDGSATDPQRISQAYLAASHACIVASDFIQAGEHAEAFLAEFPSHPSSDYAAYLSVMSRFLHWRAETQSDRGLADAETIKQGRALLSSLSQFRSAYARSPYIKNMIPVARATREIVAGSELRLAKAAISGGNFEAAALRARYIQSHYANTQAAAQAQDLLGALESTD